MKYISDKRARELARALGKLRFKTDYSELHNAAGATDHFCNIARVYSSSDIAVRATHRGAIMYLAFAPSAGRMKRVADMSQIALLPYRLAGKPKFNFSQASAELDITNEPDIYAALQKVLARYVEIGALKPVTAEESDRGAKPVRVGPFKQLAESITTMLIHTRELTKNSAASHMVTMDELSTLKDSTKEAISAQTSRLVNIQQLFGQLHNSHKEEQQALQSRLVMLEGKINQQGEWLSDFSKRNMALDAKMGTVVQLLNVIAQRLLTSPTTVMATGTTTPLPPAPAVACVREDKLAL